MYIHKIKREMVRLLAKAASNLKCLLYLNKHILGDLT